jgi:uncharacterized protein YegJ (DUF2314 family)
MKAMCVCVLGLMMVLVGCKRESALLAGPENVADDPAFAAAVEKARASFPEFVAAWRTTQRRNTFQVRKGFESEMGGIVYVWIEVTDLADGKVKGKLIEVPEFPIGLDAGARVTVSPDEIVDWLYFDIEGNVTGDFTTDAYTAFLVKKRG